MLQAVCVDTLIVEVHGRPNGGVLPLQHNGSLAYLRARNAHELFVGLDGLEYDVRFVEANYRWMASGTEYTLSRRTPCAAAAKTTSTVRESSTRAPAAPKGRAHGTGGGEKRSGRVAARSGGGERRPSGADDGTVYGVADK